MLANDGFWHRHLVHFHFRFDMVLLCYDLFEWGFRVLCVVCCAGQTIVDSSLLHPLVEVVEEVRITPGNGFIVRYVRTEI